MSIIIVCSAHFVDGLKLIKIAKDLKGIYCEIARDGKF